MDMMARSLHLSKKRNVFLWVVLFIFYVLTINAFADGENSIAYVDERGEVQYVESSQVTVLETNSTILNSGFYLSDHITVNERLAVQGDVKIILKDESELKMLKGIQVNSTNNLTIYGQQQGNGNITIKNLGGGNAAIGGDANEKAGDITINGGVINIEVEGRTPGAHPNAASIGCGARGIGGNIYINGGIIKIQRGGGGAGIGLGSSSSSGQSEIVINGGELNIDLASASGRGAAIGGGEAEEKDSSKMKIAINGGLISVKGKSGSGVGSGEFSEDGEYEIIINGGKIDASSQIGAAIGGGERAKLDMIKISGGTLHLNSDLGAAIGGGRYGNGSEVIISGGSIKARSEKSVAIGKGSEGSTPGTLKNEKDEPIYLVEAQLAEIYEAKDKVTVKSGDAYRFEEMYTDSDNKIYIYLPEGKHRFKFEKENEYFYYGIENVSETEKNELIPLEVQISSRPVASSDLAYNGEELELVNGGDVTDGKLYYALVAADVTDVPQKSEFDLRLPKAISPQKYKVYYFAKAKGYKDSKISEEPIEILISKVNPTINWTSVISGMSDSREIRFNVEFAKAGANAKLPSGKVVFKTSDALAEQEIAALELQNLNDKSEVTYIWKNLSEADYDIKLSYEGDDYYKPIDVERHFNTAKKHQAHFKIMPIETKTYGDPPFTLTTSGGSGNGAVSYRSDDEHILSIHGDVARIHKAGRVKITAIKAEDDEYNSVQAEVTLVIEEKIKPEQNGGGSISIGDSDSNSHSDSGSGSSSKVERRVNKQESLEHSKSKELLKKKETEKSSLKLQQQIDHIKNMIEQSKTRSEIPFDDVVENHWAKEAVQRLSSMGILKGANGKFMPNQPLTRAHLITLLGRLDYLSQQNDSTQNFSDVSPKSYYYEFAKWAKVNGLLNLVVGETLEPDAEMTREQMALLIVNYLQYIEYDLSFVVQKDENDVAGLFVDQELISEYAKEEVEIIRKLGLVVGNERGEFLPQSVLTRAQATIIINKLIDVLLK